MRSSSVRRMIQSARSGAKPRGDQLFDEAALGFLAPSRRRRAESAARASAIAAGSGPPAGKFGGPRVRAGRWPSASSCAASSATRSSSAARCSTSACERVLERREPGGGRAGRRDRGARRRASSRSRAPPSDRRPAPRRAAARTRSRARQRAPRARAATSSACRSPTLSAARLFD